MGNRNGEGESIELLVRVGESISEKVHVEVNVPSVNKGLSE